MTRYFAHLAYKGTNFHGWQFQPNAITVQETLNKAFSTILREEISLTGAGRTDSGVHARNFYAHFDSGNSLLAANNNILLKLNSYLPKDIYLYRILKVHENANARFDARERIYKYYISEKKEIFKNDYCWQFYQALDIEKMNEAAKLLLNHTDFTSFSKLHTDVKTNNCKLIKACWTYENDLLVFTISADRFLRNMVRSIVGTLIEVGLSKCSIQEFNDIIEVKDRSAAGTSVPAKGLFLEDIYYPYPIY